MLPSTGSAVVAVLDIVNVVPELRIPWHVQVYMLLNAEVGMYLRLLSYIFVCVCVCVCVCISYKWLTSKQQRPTWEVKGSSASQIIPRIFLNPKVQYVFTIARHFSWSRFRSSQSTTLPFVPSHDFPINNQYKAFRLKNFIELASIIPIQFSKKIVKVLRLPVKEKLPKNKVGRPLS